jgi:ParB family transcriptional regulator, chromosome partitioning protein
MDMATAAKRGLGKGLGALIPSSVPESPTPDQIEGVVYAELPIDRVLPNPRQPRTVFDEESLAELVFSIREIGLLQPIVVRRASDDAYELIAGERRLRASKEAGLASIPAIIRDTDDEAMLRDALLENLHRADLNPLEEAAAYQQLLSDFGCTQDELARRIGRSRPQVSNTLRLLRLPPDVQRRVAAGVLSAGHARALLSLDDHAAMEVLATRIVAEGLSVRAVEEIIIVGDADGRQRRSSPRTRVSVPRDPSVAEAVSDVVAQVADRLDTRVNADGFAKSNTRGRLIIECADLDDLRRVVDIINRRD